ncbi:MAG: hypothetical protein ABJA78_18400 [Ferruginibacter sp.]
MKLLSISRLLLFSLFQLFFVNMVSAQLKDYTISAKGDTINGVNKDGDKQGRWVVHVDEVRGEPGYEEEGTFKKGKKEGAWRIYNLNGDLIGIELYKFGGKDGLQQYFTYLGDLVREEQWRGYNPDAPYDTIPVYGTGSNEILNYKIVKAEQYSVKHGEWKYYEAGTGRLLKAEQYDHNRLVTPNTPAVAAADDKAKKKIEKTPEMLEWEKKNKGKKKVVRDGAVGL